jgi:hypothetical protein
MAAVACPIDMAKLLVAAKADLTAKNRYGLPFTPLRARLSFSDLLVSSHSAFAYVAGLETMPFMLQNLVMDLLKLKRIC